MDTKLFPLNLASEKNLVGGKAFNLYKLITGGFNVPKGFVLTSFEENAIKSIWKNLQAPLIVRSSAGLEDSEFLSFAGVLDSFSPINTEQELIAHVKKVFSLVGSSRVLEYLHHYNIPEETFSISVIVQEWVKPVWAGVLFTTKQQRHGLCTVIEGSPHGSGVVSGQNLVARVVFDQLSHEIKNSGHEPFLPEKIVSEILGLSLNLGKFFGSPQDVEWVWDGVNIRIVQARPITEHYISQEVILAREIFHLNDFLPKPPKLKQHQFADGMLTATPITHSLFKKIFDKSGSLGKVYKKLFLGNKLPKTDYLVSILGRLYINKDYEDDLRSYIFEGVKILKPRTILVQFIVQFRFLFFWKSLKKKVRSEFELDPRLGSKQKIEKILERILYTTTPWVLEVSMHQQYARDFLIKKLQTHLGTDEVEIVMRSGAAHEISLIPGNSKINQEFLLKKFGHRAFEELELANPRFCEEPKKLLVLLENQKIPKALSPENRDLRTKIIEMYPSLLDQQILTSFFTLYDTYSQLREQAHDLWVKDFSRLRFALLKVDAEEHLYNSIWFATIDDILGNKKLPLKKLFSNKSLFQKEKSMNLPAILELSSWDELKEIQQQEVSITLWKGVGVSSGVVSGVVGTLDDINNNKAIDILIHPSLDPNLVLAFGKIKGVAAAVGGELSHAAVLAREYGIPVVILELPAELLPGKRARLDGSNGTLELI